jgi:hypothetical protein
LGDTYLARYFIYVERIGVSRGNSGRKNERSKHVEKLYYCRSKVDYGGCSELTFNWIVVEREEQRSCEGLTKDPGDPYQEECVSQMFSEHEVEQLREYLRSQHPETELVVKEAELPTPYAAIDSCGYGGGDGGYMLYGEEGYSLPFKVMGFYRMHRHWDGLCGCPESQKFRRCPTCGQEVSGSWEKLLVLKQGEEPEERLIHAKGCLGIPADEAKGAKS